jgi:hypothetical protein
LVDNSDSTVGVSANKYNLTMGRFGIALINVSDFYDPFSFCLEVGGKFRIPNKSTTATTILANDKHKFKNKGAKNLKFLFGLDVGINYRIAKGIALGVNTSYYGNKNSLSAFDAGLAVGINLK